MDKTITLYYADIIDTVKRSLSIIGKRATNDNGDSLFDTITVSTLEEPLLEDFIVAAITAIIVELRRFVEASFKRMGSLAVPATYDFDGFITENVTIETVGLAERPYPSTILFSTVRKLFLLRVGLSTIGTLGTKYYNTWSGGEPFVPAPKDDVLFRYNSQLYRYDGSNLVTVSGSQTELTGIILSLNLADDYNEALDSSLQQALEDYCTAYTLYSWFTIVSPRLAEKYLADAVNHRSYFIAQAFHRKPATNHPNPLRTLTAPT